MEPIGRRIFLAHLELSYRLGRKVTLAEFGEMVAEALGRETPFTAAAVSRWESGSQIPTHKVIEAIAIVTNTDPGWISHGSKSTAPRPPISEDLSKPTVEEAPPLLASRPPKSGIRRRG
jgi:transcriptional regulator with XRE-family HTH domain